MTHPQPAAHAALAEALAAGVVVLDGGLSTELERRGHDVSGALWSAALIREAPEAVVEAHAAFLAAGAQVVTTASYQATYPGLAAAGLDDAESTAVLRRSVTLARQAVDAADRPAWVAASVGPYGAMLADGSEYTGHYCDPTRGGHLDRAALATFHRRRLTVLAEAGADVLACETIPCAAEAQALLDEVAALAVPAWLSLTTVTGADGVVRTRLGEDVREVFAAARDVAAVIAVGVNCTEPAGVARAVEVAAAASGKPVVVYPNSGESWDAAARAWTGSAAFAADDLASWVGAGARLVGGCCRVGPAEICALVAAIG